MYSILIETRYKFAEIKRNGEVVAEFPFYNRFEGGYEYVYDIEIDNEYYDVSIVVDGLKTSATMYYTEKDENGYVVPSDRVFAELEVELK